MTIEVGNKVDGKVSGITNFGAFVDLGQNQSGLVHISEVSDGFIKDIHSVLSVGDQVKVKVLSIADDGKIALSIRKASDKPAQPESHSTNQHQQERENFRSHRVEKRRPRTENHPQAAESFDQMLSGFLKDSETRLSTLKRNTDGKRGGRGGRRS